HAGAPAAADEFIRALQQHRFRHPRPVGERLHLLPLDLAAGTLSDAVAHGPLRPFAPANQAALGREAAHHVVVADDRVVEVDADPETCERHKGQIVPGGEAGRPRSLRQISMTAARCSAERFAIVQRPSAMRTWPIDTSRSRRAATIRSGLYRSSRPAAGAPPPHASSRSRCMWSEVSAIFTTSR